ncbi:hypothetical protein PV325_000584 [Microctonus aethiopoides]|nr:hypothetical protein PV325_000584 [Microctonus aethiopoides]KAK0091998.1 hypothetical protein PV326_002398 [Microctonus aethiopoides]
MLSRKFNTRHWLIFFESCVSLNSLEIFLEKALINSLKSRRDISHWLQVTSFRRTGFECSTIKDRQVPAGESPDCNQKFRGKMDQNCAQYSEAKHKKQNCDPSGNTINN